MPPERLAARRIAYEISLRAERDKLRRERDAVVNREQVERAWRTKLENITAVDPALLAVPQLKLIIVCLMSLLQVAPTEEDAHMAQQKIAESMC